MAIGAEGKRNLAIIAGLVALILIGGLFAVRSLAPRRPLAGQGPWEYTVYGEDVVTGEIVEFPVYMESLTWPQENPKTGNECYPLYFCSDCGAVFTGNPTGMTTQCPECGSGNVGGYSPELEEEFQKSQADAE